MRSPDDSTPSTSFYDPAVLAELARQTRETAQEAAGTDEYRVVGEVVHVRPERPACRRPIATGGAGHGRR